MKSFATLFREEIKNSIILGDYLFWLLFDFSKFRIFKKESIKKIIIIHLGALGELLASTPILPALKNSFNCNISLMVRKNGGAIFENNPHVEKVITYEENAQRNIENLKRGGFDMAVIIFPGNIKMAKMCLNAGIRYRIGCYKGVKDGPGFFFTRRSFPLKKQHIIEKYLDIVRLVGADNKNPRMEFYPPKETEKKVKSFLKRNKIKKYAIIHPGFGGGKDVKYPSRYWPEERYAKVADYLIKKKKLKVLITGIKDEGVMI